VNALEPAVHKDGHAQCTSNTSREPGTIRGTARRPHFPLAIISVTVQLRIYLFLVISVYFNLRNILPNFGTFLPRNPVYTELGTKNRQTHLYNTIRLGKRPFFLCFSSRGN